jgi:hypothetical protein
MVKFSLCIPTMDRFDSFLHKYLEEYIKYDLIDEIIITDETGNDYDKIQHFYQYNTKIKVHKNEQILGPLLNKLKVCSLASNEWVVLMDSDNFANEEYFQTANEYLINNIKENEKNIILSPSNAKPNFNFSHLSGMIYKSGTFMENKNKENEILPRFVGNCHSSVLINTGNYVINKYLITNLNLTNEIDNIEKTSSCDVIYLNILLFEQLNLNLHVVSNLEYEHVVHDGSVYIRDNNKYRHFNTSIYNRYSQLT